MIDIEDIFSEGRLLIDAKMEGAGKPSRAVEARLRSIISVVGRLIWTCSPTWTAADCPGDDGVKSTDFPPLVVENIKLSIEAAFHSDWVADILVPYLPSQLEHVHCSCLYW